MDPNILIWKISSSSPRFLEIFFPFKKCCSGIFFPHVILIFFQYYLDPPVKLNEALERYGLKKDDFFILHHGESRNLNTNDRFEN